jgi:hypothetical protein
MELGALFFTFAQLRQELHNNQDNNNDSQHVDETACKRNAGKEEAQLRQELHNNQDNNNDSQHVDETACKRNAGKDRLPEETEQPESGQHQDRQAKHGIPLYESAFVTRSVFPGDMIWRSIKIG